MLVVDQLIIVKKHTNILILFRVQLTQNNVL